MLILPGTTNTYDGYDGYDMWLKQYSYVMILAWDFTSII